MKFSAGKDVLVHKFIVSFFEIMNEMEFDQNVRMYWTCTCEIMNESGLAQLYLLYIYFSRLICLKVCHVF